MIDLLCVAANIAAFGLVITVLVYLIGVATGLAITAAILLVGPPMFARDNQEIEARRGRIITLRRAWAEEVVDILDELIPAVFAWPYRLLRPVVRFVSDIVSDR